MVRGKTPYIPYTMLTQGEMKLALLAEQADIYAQAFPENREYAQAKNMLDNALRVGVSNGVNFVGALYNPVLQQVAKEIAQASRQTRPASRGGLLGRQSLSTGIGDIVLDFDHDCVQYAAKAANKELRQDKSWKYYDNFGTPEREKNVFKKYKGECKIRVDIEKIVNQSITNASHHVVYYGLQEDFPAIKDTMVATKHLFHTIGIQGLANATDVDKGLMATWSETSILAKNTAVGVGPVDSINSSFYLSKDPDAYLASYVAWQKKRGGASIKGIGNPVAAVIIPLIGAITAAVVAAADMQKQLNAKRAGAMAAAQGYGTDALLAKESDFGEKKGQPPAGSGSNTLLLVGAAAAGIYLLTNK